MNKKMSRGGQTKGNCGWERLPELMTGTCSGCDMDVLAFWTCAAHCACNFFFGKNKDWDSFIDSASTSFCHRIFFYEKAAGFLKEKKLQKNNSIVRFSILPGFFVLLHCLSWCTVTVFLLLVVSGSIRPQTCSWLFDSQRLGFTRTFMWWWLPHSCPALLMLEHVFLEPLFCYW